MTCHPAGLLPAGKGVQHRRHRKRAEDSEYGAPAELPGNQGAGNRPERRHESQHRTEQAVDDRAFRPVGIDVAHSGEHRDHGRRGSGCLQEAQGNEDRGGRRAGKEEGGQGENERAGDQYRAPADPVG